MRFTFVFILASTAKVISEHRLINVVIQPGIEPGTLQFVEYYSAVWCSAANTHLKLLDRVVIGAGFLTAGVYAYDIAYRRSVAVECAV